MKMKYVLIMLIGLAIFSCEKKGKGKYHQVDETKKRPLQLFSEEEVVKYAVSVYLKTPSENLTIAKTEDGFVLVKKDDSGEKNYYGKVGPHGFVLIKEDGEWKDVLNERRIFYSEQEDTVLIISEAFVTSDSSARFDFYKKDPQ